MFGFMFGTRRAKKQLEEAMARHDQLMNETIQLFADNQRRVREELAKYDHIFARFEK